MKSSAKCRLLVSLLIPLMLFSLAAGVSPLWQEASAAEQLQLNGVGVFYDSHDIDDDVGGDGDGYPESGESIGMPVTLTNTADDTFTGVTATLSATTLIPTVIFSDDMEAGEDEWTCDGLWHLSEHHSVTPTHAWYYGIEVVYNYETGASNAGSLISPVIDLTLFEEATLSFWYWYETETTGTSYDQRWVEISVNGGPFEELEQLHGNSMSTWHEKTIDLSDYMGNTIQIRFRFDTVDSAFNDYEGWYIDDVVVTGLTSGPDPYITITDSYEEYGDIPAGSSAPSLDDYNFDIDPLCPEGYVITFNLDITASNGGPWEDSFEVVVTSSISGQVRDLDTGDPISGATIYYDGPISGNVTTSSGSYTICGLLSGTYTLYATASGYNDSYPVDVAVPPNASGIDFELGYSDIDVTPVELEAWLQPGETETQTLNIANLGNLDLTFNLSEGSEQWQLLLEDPDESEIWMDLSHVYAKNNGEHIYFGVEFYEPWPDDPHDYINTMILLDTDQNPDTGLSNAHGLYEMNDIGADYAAVVGMDGDSVWRWTGVGWQQDWATFTYLDLESEPNSFEIGFELSDIDNPEAIDLIVINIDIAGTEEYWDYAPIEGDGHVTFGAPWLIEEPVSGTVAPAGSTDISVTFNTAGLDYGQYNTNIIIETNDPDESMVIIPVQLTVVGVVYESHEIDDSIGGDGDGCPEPGESIRMPVALRSYSNDTFNDVTATLVIPFFDDMEAGEGGWTYDGLWHLSEHRSVTPTHAWYYGIEVVWNYNTGVSNAGSLISPVIDLTLFEEATLSFWYWYETETTGTSYDQRWVEISVNGGPFEALEQLYGDSMSEWHEKTIDLSDYVGNKIQIRFYFDTVDSAFNDYEGWYIDDVAVTSSTLGPDLYITITDDYEEYGDIPPGDSTVSLDGFHFDIAPDCPVGHEVIFRLDISSSNGGPWNYYFRVAVGGGITVTPTSGLVTTEAEGAATFTVVLNSEPTANVSIGISSGDTTEGAVSPSSVTFNSTNWNTPQTVTVTGVDDAIDDDDIAYEIITAPAISADPNYSSLNSFDVSVTNNDDDVAGITVAPTSGLVTTEAGDTATFTVVLNSEPTADVIIGLSSSDTSEGTVSPSSVTFNSTNWDTSKTVTVIGVDDAIDDDDITYQIITAPATSDDPKYNNINAPDVGATNNNDDVAGITVTPTSGLVTTEAGDTATFTVVLNSEPTADVTIGISSSDTAEGTVSPSSVTFNSTNWNTTQTVTVTGVDDAINDDDIAYEIITAPATSNDPNYSNFDASDVSVTNNDNDNEGTPVWIWIVIALGAILIIVASILIGRRLVRRRAL